MKNEMNFLRPNLENTIYHDVICTLCASGKRLKIAGDHPFEKKSQFSSIFFLLFFKDLLIFGGNQVKRVKGNIYSLYDEMSP